MIMLSSDAWKNASLSGIEIAQQALSAEVGPWAEHFLSIAISLFAFTTLIGNYYYGQTNIEFIPAAKAG
jgi:Na+/alanine symporter